MRSPRTVYPGVGLMLWLLVTPACDEAPANTAPTRESHTQYFPINTPAHGNIDCNTCHGAFDTFTKFDCLNGCHVQPETDGNHAGVPGYSWDSPACYKCHPTGDKFGIDRKSHAKYFPIDVGDKHESAACAKCHADASNRQNVSCANACHDAGTSAKHTNVGGYDWTSPLCLRCHADSQLNPVATHLPFTIAAGKHHLASCLKCHPASRADKPWGADFNPFECFTCHNKGEMDNHHAGFPGYQSVATSCVQSGCHPNGRVP